MDLYKKYTNPVNLKDHIEWLKRMDALYYPVYPTKQLLVQYYFKPDAKFLSLLKQYIGEDFYEIVQRDTTFIREKEISSKHRDLLPILFNANQQNKMKSMLWTNDYKKFKKALDIGAPLSTKFVDRLVKKSTYNTLIDINIYRECIAYMSVNQFFDLIHHLKDSKDSIPHIRLILSNYPEYVLALEGSKSPFFYIVKYGISELAKEMFVQGYFDDMYDTFLLSLNTKDIAMFLVDKMSNFTDKQANHLVQTMITKNLYFVCVEFSSLQFKVDYETQLMIMSNVNFFYILKDKFDICGIRRLDVIKECINRYKKDKSLKPMVDFYMKQLSADDLKYIKKSYVLKF